MLSFILSVFRDGNPESKVNFSLWSYRPRPSRSPLVVFYRVKKCSSFLQIISLLMYSRRLVPSLKPKIKVTLFFDELSKLVFSLFQNKCKIFLKNPTIHLFDLTLVFHLDLPKTSTHSVCTDSKSDPVPSTLSFTN